MRLRMKKFTYLILNCFLLVVIGAVAASAGDESRDLQKALQSLGPDDEIAVIVRLSDKADISPFKHKDKGRRRADIIKALKDKAEKTQGPVKIFLEKKKAKKIKSLWVINGIAAAVPASLVNDLANFPGVEAVTLDAVVHVPVVTAGTAAAPEWNISAVHAPDLWNMGYTGQGIVVANMDSGVYLDHPDLQGKWRGGMNSWYDPNGEHPLEPYDAHGHGTGTMGIMVGGDAGGSFIGVAPGAQWIAVKIYNDAGDASYSAIHQGFQWLLDPDENRDTDDAPDVVNNSWGLEPNHSCLTEFQPDVQALKSSGIALAFSAGNDGPNPSTGVSPANYPESFSVGAIGDTNIIANFSSRGPSACDGSIFPHVVAPGMNVKTADLYVGIPGAYATVSGTSFAAPHVAGAMALLLSAFPDAIASELEEAIKSSAADLGPSGPDNDSGYGLLDVYKAYNLLTPACTITASAGPGGTISPSGIVVVNPGECPTFTITPWPGYRISNVFVDGVAVGGVSTYTLCCLGGENHTISAFFAPIMFTINSFADIGGAIACIPAYPVSYGTTVNCAITPNEDYRIKNVFVDGVSQGVINTYTFTNVTANHNMSARFTALTYTINTAVDVGGAIACTPANPVSYGSDVTCMVTADPGYRIKNVFVDGVSQGAINTYTFTNVTANHNMSVRFAALTYTINTAADAGGTIVCTPANPVGYGSNVICTVTADPGYRIKNVFVDGVSQGAINTYTFTNATANHNMSARFAALTYTINTAADVGGAIACTPVNPVGYGYNVTCTVAADEGYRIKNVFVDGVSQGAIDTHTFTNVTTNHNMSARFALN